MSRGSGADDIRIAVVNVAAEEEPERGGADLDLQLEFDVEEGFHLTILEDYHVEE
jgi:hypothetical protein